ncbi:hypothetical protein E4U17_003972 [Claviceps sp. LM77 group G4]|nr:hypothetical protein E4U17_003972 [Claviceps sp. LM77 group G4]KAG6073626.1 hypothetical protein E4U33_002802 [Claviceps sp. LM78 group G4]KAG6077365.1 hypothetical protein E4U16_002265 [Claviceps sp. LM84 group G4]
MVGLVDVSEAARERETFRYDSSLIQHTVRYSPDTPILSSQLRSSPDSALTAFAQLAALRLKTSRALISLFDATHQYVVAEATPNLGLQPDCAAGDSGLWLSNIAIPRTYGVCERVLTASPSSVGHVKNESSDEILPVTVIDDLTADIHFADLPLVKSGWPRSRFYAAAPIRTHHGVNIGVLCVVDEEPRIGLAADEMRFMWELSKVIMGHLESKRAMTAHGRTERMVRGISSFIDGSTTLTKNKFDVTSTSDQNRDHVGDTRTSSMINTELLATSAADAVLEEVATDQDVGKMPLGEEKSRPRIRASTMSVASSEGCVGENDVAARARRIYTKAAKALCFSLDVEGLVFLDANVTSFGGARARDFRDASATSSSSWGFSSASSSSSPPSSSSDEYSSPGCRGNDYGERHRNRSREPSFAPVLGFSGTSLPMVQDDSATSHQPPELPQLFLRKLLRRYPQGTIFNFNQSGTVQSTDCSSEEASADQGVPVVLHEGHRRSASGKRARMKKSEQEMLMHLLPGARCIAFAPVWDPSTQRWSAGAFAYTKASSRIFSTKVELTYLIAFGTIVMSEVSRLRATMANKSRMDMLSSLSHELRSPLHGLVLGVDMLHDTALDRLQKEFLNTVETCGRTLLDTVDHLLHWAKINNFMTRPSSTHTSALIGHGSKRDLGVEHRNSKSVEAGMMSITTHVAVDALAEEVVESVFAGHTYQKLIAVHAAKASSSVEPKCTALQRLDRMHVSMEKYPDLVASQPGDVVVSLDVESNVNWVFLTQAGALRRVIMNLLGNSLKYTTRGFVQVSLSQRPAIVPCSSRMRARTRFRRDVRTVCLTVSDSGKGMTEEFLQSHLFVPFSQEDRLSPGVGLGLSLVKKIVSGLGGRIKVQSSRGNGTTISVELPLELAVPQSLCLNKNGETPLEPESTALKDTFERHVAALRGLYVRVAGFAHHTSVSVPETGQILTPDIGKPFDEGASILAICRDWLHMTVLDTSTTNDEGTAAMTKEDVLICTAAHLDWIRGECREILALMPVVVLCVNVAATRTVESRCKDCSPETVLEYSSQPVGPRKLARALASCVERWHQKASPGASIELPQSRELSRELLPIDAMVAGDLPPGKEPPNDKTLLDSGSCADALSPLNSIASSQKAVNVTSTKSPSPPTQDRFLVVDDNPINLKILSSCLQKMGHLHDAVCNGKEAVHAFRRGAGAYKGIFMDLSMPVMSGFEASCLIRQHEKEAKLETCTIFALTGLASAEAQQEAFACGIDLFLTKPVRLKELRQVLTSKGLT